MNSNGSDEAATAQALQQAMALHRQGRQLEAEAGYRAILARTPNHFDALYLFGLLRVQQGGASEAFELVSAALKQNPQSAPAHAALGSILLNLGRPEEALACFDTLVTRDPRDVDARYNRAIVLGGLGRVEPGLADYEQVLAARPGDAVAWFNRGNLLAQAGRDPEAIDCYDRALATAPQRPEPLLNRGNVLSRLGRNAEAIASFERALALDPRQVEAMSGRAIALRALKRYDEALASCEQALALKPDHIGALIARGNILLMRRDHEGAIRQFERVLAIAPGQPDALHNRGFALAALNRLGEALACYDEALRVQPRHADALNNRGIALHRLGRHEEAIASYDAALALRPDDADTLNNRAHALAKLDRYTEAIADCERALASNPRHAHALGDLAFYRLLVCDWPETRTLPARLDQAIGDGGAIVQPFVFVALPVSASDHLRYTRAFLAGLAESAPKPVHFTPTPAPPRRAGKIRLAYLSADFYRHPTAWLAAGLFERHDRSRFELVGVSFGPDDESDIRRRVERSFDQFHDVRVRTDGDVAKLLHDLQVDIAVDLKGHTENSRPAILAGRPAPVQVSFLGYPGTTALEAIDYIIADPIVLPFDQQPFYTEKIVHLPDCYQVNDATKAIAPAAPSRRELGLPEQAFVFCCFNQSYKFTPEIFDIWMRLLRRFEGSLLWLLHSNDAAADNLRGQASARGVDPGRLVFAPKMELAAHLARHRAADLFLDTLPCNAHTTASDALWAGLPVLTCLGTTFTGRVAASLLHAVGLPELATTSLSDYEALAGSLASDPARMALLRRTLESNRLSQPLFDTGRFCGHIEAAYATMWQRWQQGDAPQGFAVERL